MTCGVGYECAPPGGCSEHFRSLALFDSHQSFRGEGPVVCLTPGQMVAKGWRIDAAGAWTENEGPGKGGARHSDPTDCSQSDGEAA